MGRSFIYVQMLKELRQNIEHGVSRMRMTADTTGMADQLFQDYVRPVIDHYVPIVSPLAEHYGCRLLRARKCIDQLPFTDIADLLNPPIPTGRALGSNVTAILYASSSMQTCLAETDPKIGDLLTVVGLDYTNIKDRLFWFVGQLASFSKSLEPSHYIADRKELHRTAYFPEEARHSFLFQDALLNEVFSLFSSPNDGFALSRLLIDAVQSKRTSSDELSGVGFLSTKDAPGVNFAIFGDAIQEIKTGQLNLVEIVDIDEYGFVAYKLLKNGSLHGDQITWRDVPAFGAVHSR